MNFSRTINKIRRSLTRLATKNIGTSHLEANIDSISREKIMKVLICRPNHRLGNLLMITPLVQEVLETFPHASIDLFVKGNLASQIFKHYKNIDRIIQLPRKPFSDILKYLGGWALIRRNRYDLVINVINHSSSGRLATKFANARYRSFGDINDDIRSKYDDNEHMAKQPVYSFRDLVLNSTSVRREMAIAWPNLKLNSFEIAQGAEIVRKLVGNDKRTICLFTHATGLKQYSAVWWETFYARLKAEYPEFNIVEMLPVENISQLSFKAPTFYSKDIREIGSVIVNTAIFISADCGMMHLASSANAPTIGLFKVTNPNSYQPYNDDSVGIDTTKHSIDDCVKIINHTLFHKEARNLSS